MFDKSHIILLIQQDLKHSQLTETLRHMGLDDGGLYALDLITIVARLMEVPPHQMDDFAEVYGTFLDEAPQYPTTYLGEALLPVAEECYKKLLGCLEG
ncbi:hypothetical protein EZV76_15035 [Flagellimonas alvinocaridis]|uniref:Uncharacterized protein n=1 Tax=Flagellimonas alvinocaridis TaxID=2530200 RepID=A0A4S8RG86_9FLAO|nr:hypothetical protein [Allomuricauda alvinocaridis]THV57307.1 hypothetical protein EZV76_15035 [Allomuricauda alvinocaridis]